MRGRYAAGAVVFVVLAAGSTGVADEATKTVAVDCARGETIAKALTLGGGGKPLLVVVRGTCNESVIVDRTDVTLDADSAGAGISGSDPNVDTIAVTANRVTIKNLTITGGRNGITATGAAGLTVRSAIVQSTGRSGVVYVSGASGVVDGCTIQLNPRDGVVVEAAQTTIVNSTVSKNARNGVFLTNGASARIGLDNLVAPGGNTITLNGTSGVQVGIGSAALIAMNAISGNGGSGVNVVNATADIIGGNTISDNAAAGVNARSGSVLIGDQTTGLSSVNTISGNGTPSAQGGVFGFLGSSLVVRDAIISGNKGFGLGLSLKSDGQLFSSTIQNNLAIPSSSPGDGVRLIFGSGLFISQPNTIVSGNAGFGLQCTDGESSVINTSFLSLSGNGLGGTSGTCTGF